jgi:hypothetical protein
MPKRALIVAAALALITAAPQVVSAAPVLEGSALKTASEAHSNIQSVWYGYGGYYRPYHYGYRGYGYRGYGYRGYGRGYGYGYRGYYGYWR